MPPIALDTNVYVDLLRGAPNAGAILSLAAASPPLVVLGPVVGELRLGAPPPADEWARAGATGRAMLDAGHDAGELTRRGFFVDVVVAVLCRARGVTLVTDDADHARIRAYVGHAVMAVPRG
jgi:predicted nucleic acid-binding protein